MFGGVGWGQLVTTSGCISRPLIADVFASIAPAALAFGVQAVKIPCFFGRLRK